MPDLAPAGTLGTFGPRPLVMVVIGDHQPTTPVTGSRASWDVPAHVISEDAAPLQRLQLSSFVAALQPPAAPLGAMYVLTALLLQVFDAPAPDAPTVIAGPGTLSALPGLTRRRRVAPSLLNSLGRRRHRRHLGGLSAAGS